MGIPFGRYELLKRIAAGGMGEVFLARQTGMEGFEKLLVVKVLLPHLVEDQEFVTMFFDEARIAARLNHPNVAQLFDLGEHEGNFYIAMEYIHGEDVVRLWKTARAKEMPVPLALSARIAADAAAGLDYAHKAVDSNNRPLKLVHRDVSPQNILVTFDGGVKLIDFGVAKAVGRASHTATGTLKGKYSYMSPEQAAGKDIDHRSDVFALGVVFYEMATSLRLFKRETEISTLKAVEACEVPRPSDSNPEIDPHLEGVLLKALAADPANRFQDAASLRLALEDWLVSKRLSGSAAHLAAYMRTLYADRLAAESAEGRPFSDFEGTPSAIFRRGSSVAKPQTGAGMTGPTAAMRPPRSRAPLIYGGIAAAVLALGLAVGARPLLRLLSPPAAPEIKRPAATLSVVTRPAGARVLIEGASVGQTPLLTFALEENKRVGVDIVLEGFKPLHQDVLGNGQQTLDSTLEPLAVAPPAPAQVLLKLTSQPAGAAVSLGEAPLGTTPVDYKAAKGEGELVFTFKLAGYKPEKRSVVPGADAEVKATLARLGPGPSHPHDDLGIKTGR